MTTVPWLYELQGLQVIGILQLDVGTSESNGLMIPDIYHLGKYGHHLFFFFFYIEEECYYTQFNLSRALTRVSR